MDLPVQDRLPIVFNHLTKDREKSPLCQVNVNFGTHNCVHMGTAIETEIAAYEPSAVSWPAEDGQLYTLVS